MTEREQAITEMIELVQQADSKVQEIAEKKTRKQRSKTRRGRLRRALRRALKK